MMMMMMIGKRNDWQIVAVANFNHGAIRVVEEKLIQVNATLLYPSLYVLYLHLLQHFLHRRHALTLHSCSTHLFHLLL